MLKSTAIEILGSGDLSVAAEVLGISYQAVNKWPEVLPSRISDRVLGACLRNGIDVPPAVLLENYEPKQATTLSSKAKAATETVANGAIHA